MIERLLRGYGKAFLVSVFYFTCSISMNFLNKAVVSSYSFNYPFFIMACQMLATVIVLDIIRTLKLSPLSAYSLKDGVEFLPCSLSFATHRKVLLWSLQWWNSVLIFYKCTYWAHFPYLTLFSTHLCTYFSFLHFFYQL